MVAGIMADVVAITVAGIVVAGIMVAGIMADVVAITVAGIMVAGIMADVVAITVAMLTLTRPTPPIIAGLTTVQRTIIGMDATPSALTPLGTIGGTIGITRAGVGPISGAMCWASFFWPYAVYNPFWFYGPDFIVDTIFWPSPYGGYGYARPYDIYGYGGHAYPPHHHRHVAPGTTPLPSPLPTEACTGVAPGVTDLPIDQIARAVHPTGDQIAALDELKAASAKAADVLKASCPTEVPFTPISRLDALERRD